MAIEHAILGMLSWKSMTGYEMKHLIENSSSMYWSGNNNQIYKALVQLLNAGLVTNVVEQQESLPAKKIYTVTPEGLAALRAWILSQPEAPDVKKSFLIQLSWADLLTDEELAQIVDQYEKEVELQFMIEREKQRRDEVSPNRTPREKILWEMIRDNLLSAYQNEIEWIQRVKSALSITEGRKN